MHDKILKATKVIVGVMVSGAMVVASGQIASATTQASSVSVEERGSRATIIAKDRIGSYGERETLELLIAGKGPIAQSNPETVELLGFDPDRAQMSDELLEQVTDAYVVFNPDFGNELLPDLTSGDPNVVSDALGRFYASIVEFWNTDPVFAEARKAVSEKPLVSTDARGSAVQNINFVVNVNALVNLNVAGVALGAVAIFAVALVYTRYLDDPNKLYAIDQANMIREVTATLY